MNKPRIFIGSSSEGLNVANAIHQNLENFAEPTVWTHDLFKLSTPLITSLIDSLDNFDFAIFVFTPNDITTIRGEVYNTVRDNVIFETGLFAGRYGIQKVFFVKPRNIELHLPSDLLGVLAGEYTAERTDGNLLAATGAFCNQLQHTIIKIISKSDVIKPENDKYLNDLRLIEIYMEEKNWHSISFERIANNIKPELTEAYLMEIIEAFPSKIRRCKISGEKFGIKLISKQ